MFTYTYYAHMIYMIYIYDMVSKYIYGLKAKCFCFYISLNHSDTRL